MLLACAMLFSCTDLTALAAEPDVKTEVTAPGGESEAAEPGKDDTTDDSGGGIGQPDQPEQGDGDEEIPGTGADGEGTEDRPGTEDVTDEDDTGAADGENVTDGPDDDAGETDEGSVNDDADKEGKDESDKPDAGDGEDSETGRDEEESVSDNSVSENSVSENSTDSETEPGLSMQRNISVEASGGLGSLLLDELQLAAQEEADAATEAYGISEIKVEGTKAEASVHAAGDCTIVVSVYEEGSNRLAASGHAPVWQGESSVSVKIETDSMPEFFVVKGYLVDTDSLRPLSKEYGSSMYTETMQAFLKKTTDDFDESQTVNLDEDKTTNFVVVNDEVVLIREKEAGESSANELISYDESTNTYAFTNVNDKITGLQEGDIFVYQYNESDILPIKVGDIRLENEINAVITAVNDELCVEDIFQYVRIDENRGTADAEEIDPSKCAKGVTYLGRGSEAGRAIEGSVDIQPDRFSWDLNWPEDGEEESEEHPFGAKGDVIAALGIEVSVKYYFDLHPIDTHKESIWHVDIGIVGDAKLEGTIKLWGEGSIPILMAPVEINTNLLTVKYIPELVWGVEFEGSLKTEFTISAGIKLGEDEEGTGPYFNAEWNTLELSAELNGYIGIQFNPELKVLGILEAELEIGGRGGLEVSYGAGISSTTQEETTRHECEGACISGNGYVSIPFEGGLKILKLREVNLNEQFELSGELLKVSFGNFYYSFKNRQFGWGECPFKEYKTLVMVRTLSDELVSGAKVTIEGADVEEKTNEQGVALIWLPGGSQMIYAAYEGKNGSKRINIDGIKSVEVILGMYAGLGKDTVTQICLGHFDRSAAVTSDGSLYTWGSNALGSLGTGGTDDKSIPTKVMDQAKTVLYGSESGARTSAAITEKGELYTWGENHRNALGNGTTDNRYTPGKILDNVKSVCLGYYNGAAVTKDGQLYMWGANGSGQLGTGTTVDQPTPMRILADENVREVGLGTDMTFGYSAAVTTDGKLYMWGYNGHGELGNGDTYGKREPVRILENEKIKKVCLSQRNGYSAAVTESGQLYLWGANFYGQLGNATTAYQTEPVRVLEGIKVKEIELSRGSNAGGQSAAIAEDGSLYLWGRNTYGQLGTGDTDNRTVPFRLEQLGKVKAVRLGEDNTAAITEGGELYMWGRNRAGKLGDGTTTDRQEPVKILDDVVSVEVQDAYTAAVTVDGSLWMWGLNNNGQLGTGEESFTPVTSPVRVTFSADTGAAAQRILEGYAADGEGVLSPAGETYLYDEEALESKEAAYVYVTMRTASYPENSPAITADADNPAKQTADFSGLKPKETYNVYVMKDRDAIQRFSNGNLLYIMQAVSGEDGSLSVTYEMREACAQPDVFCVGMTRTDLSAAEISVPDIIYDGEAHVAEAHVVCNGRTLIAGSDFELCGDVLVSEIGEYKVLVRGTGTYCGEREVTFRVKNDDGGDPDQPDPPDPVYGDVLPEDVPADGKIPEGLWIAGVAGTGYDYTGKAVKPEVRVYDHMTRLKEKTDYTIAYKNNTKAYETVYGEPGFEEKKAPTITVTGKGNYTGKEIQTFRILRLDIGAGQGADGTPTEDTPFAADNMTIAYKKAAQKPVPVLLWNDRKLKNKTEYTVAYFDSTGEKRLDSVKEEGNYIIELAGQGNFTGTRRIGLTVTGKLKLMGKMAVSKIPNAVYTGSAIEPAVTVRDGKAQLKAGEHYTVAYSHNTQIGTAYAIITGKPEAGYSGTKRVGFKITGTAINKAVVTGLSGRSFVYGGINHEPELALRIKIDGKDEGLEKGTHYTVSWQKNRDAGTATVVFTGKGRYTGTLKKTFKIRPYNIAGDEKGRIHAAPENEAVPYAKGGAKQGAVVTFTRDDGTTLTLEEGKDYTLSYRNINALSDGSGGKQPTITVKGKGNFAGTYSQKLTYRIATQDVGMLTLMAADKTYQNKKNNYATKVTVTDLDGKSLRVGTDYEKTFVYTYKNETTVKTGTAADSGTAVRAAGETVGKNDVIPAGTVLQVKVTAKDGGNYTGILTGEYRIAQASISSASVSASKQIYTGQEIKPDKSQFTVKIKGKQVPEDQWEIVPDSYRNNVRKGTASVMIRGLDNYGGTKTVKFTIRAKGFFWWWRK